MHTYTALLILAIATLHDPADAAGFGSKVAKQLPKWSQQSTRSYASLVHATRERPTTAPLLLREGWDSQLIGSTHSSQVLRMHMPEVEEDGHGEGISGALHRRVLGPSIKYPVNVEPVILEVPHDPHKHSVDHDSLYRTADRMSQASAGSYGTVAEPSRLLTKQPVPRHVLFPSGRYHNPKTHGPLHGMELISGIAFYPPTLVSKLPRRRMAEAAELMLLSDLDRYNTHWTEEDLRPVFADIVTAVTSLHRTGTRLVAPTRSQFIVYRKSSTGRLHAQYLGRSGLDLPYRGPTLALEQHFLAEVIYHTATDVSPGAVQGAEKLSGELRALVDKLYAGQFKSLEHILEDPFFKEARDVYVI